MPENTLIEDIEAFLRHTTTPTGVDTYASTPKPSAGRVGYDRLVIQGDIAFVPGENLYTFTRTPIGWTPLTGPLAVVPGEVAAGGHTHWLIPSGNGVVFKEESFAHSLGRLHIPNGVTVRVHHDAEPVEHDDLYLTGGLTWGIRRQQYILEAAPDRHRPIYEADHPTDAFSSGGPQ